jgi:hypothetical protein
VQQCRHFSVKRRFALGKRAIQIENNQLFHNPVTSLRLPGRNSFRYRHFQEPHSITRPKITRSHHNLQEQYAGSQDRLMVIADADRPRFATKLVVRQRCGKQVAQSATAPEAILIDRFE